MNKTIAILPLRSKNERIIDKNIRIVGYYPLFVHIIRMALSVQEIDKIVISTDSNKYKNLINNYFHDENKIKVIICSNIISGSDTKDEEVMSHVLESLGDVKSFKNMVLVQAATPLTETRDLENAIFKINNEKLNSVFSVSASKRFYLNDLAQIIERPETQKKSTIYEVGCFWVVNINAFKKVKNRVIEPFGTVLVSERSSLYVDDFESLEVVDLILSKRIRINERRYYKSRNGIENNDIFYSDSKVDPDGFVRNILYEEDSRVEFAKDEIKYLNDYASKISATKKEKLLSIGLGGGYAEKLVSNRFEKYGVEPDVEAAKIAKKNVDYLFNDRFENIEFSYSSFDVIFAHHVIEHVKKPIEFVAKINHILKVGGKLIISSPNFDSAAARRYGSKFRMLNGSSHISLFSEIGLRELLLDHGFIVDYVDFPFFETKYFNKKDLEKMLNKDIVSPPFYGSVMTFYATKR